MYSKWNIKYSIAIFLIYTHSIFKFKRNTIEFNAYYNSLEMRTTNGSIEIFKRNFWIISHIFMNLKLMLKYIVIYRNKQKLNYHHIFVRNVVIHIKYISTFY